MILAYLLDEHIPKWWRRAILQLAPDLIVWCVGDHGAPPLQTPDSALLTWCEEKNAYLVTNNRESMPQHLADHVAQGRHIPGIFIVDPDWNIRDLAAELQLISGASLENEHRDQIVYLSLT